MKVGKEKKEERSVLFVPGRRDLEEKVLGRGKSHVGKRRDDLVGGEEAVRHCGRWNRESRREFDGKS